LKSQNAYLGVIPSAGYDFIIPDLTVNGADFFVMDSIVASTVEPDKIHVAAAFYFGRVQGHGNGDQTEAQHASPRGPAGGIRLFFLFSSQGSRHDLLRSFMESNDHAWMSVLIIRGMLIAVACSPGNNDLEQRGDPMIRKLASGKYRLYSRKINPKTGKRRNLGTFSTLADAKKHERAVQFFKRH